MHRALRIAAAAIVASPLALASAAGGAAPRAELRGYVCQTALDPPARAIAITSVMRPVAGTKSMALRFQLLSRPAGATAFSAVSGSGLGTWLVPANKTLGSRPGDVWILDKPVVDLPAPAQYKFRVTFRWTGTRHRVLAETARTSATCHQPELRPDLAIRRIAAPVPNKAGTLDLYTVTIANAGATAAGPFAVQLTAHGSAPVSKQVAGLGAHRTTQLTLRGPVCSPAAPPVITVDPFDQVDEYTRADNVATVSCTTATTPF